MFWKRKKTLHTSAHPVYVLFVMLLLGVVLFPAIYVALHPRNTVEAVWYNDNWRYRKKLTIDETKVAGTTDFTDFPVLYSVTDANLASYAQTDADDIVFTNQNGQKLDHDIESYNSGTGALVAWIRVPTLYAQQDTILYMYYGNSTAINQQNPRAVWPQSTHKGAWHLKEDPSGTAPQMMDSTDLNNFATSSGTMTSGDLVTGQVNGAINFDGVDDALNAGSADSLDDVFTSGGSITAWIRVNGWGENSNGRIIDKSSATTGGTGWTFAGNNSAGVCGARTGNLLFFHGWSGSSAQWCTNTGTITTATWYHVVLTYDKSSTSNAPVIYINGTSQTINTITAASGTANSDAGQSFVIGNRQATGDRSFDGDIDEVRVYKTTLSADWVTTEYNNQSSPSTFFTSATAEESAGPIAYWRFDEGNDNTCSGASNDACDATIQANDLAKTNATWKTEDFCVSGKCVYFDGTTDYLARSDDADLDFAGTDSFTLSTWFKHDTMSAGQQVILSKYSNGVGGEGGYKILMESDGDITCGIDNNETSFPSDSVTSTLATYDDNTWHHVECVKSGSSSLTLYIDGVIIGTDATITASTLANSNSFYVGSDASAGTNNWTGFIDEVKVYRTARSQLQVRTDFASRGSENGVSARLGAEGGQGAAYSDQRLINGMVGYWQLDEASWTNNCSTATVSDNSGNGYTGKSCPNTTGPTGGGVGRFGSTGSFDGSDDYLDFGDPSTGTLDFGTGDFSVAFWINTTTTAQDTIMGKGAVTGAGFRIGTSTDGRIELILHDGGSFRQAGLGTNYLINTGTWQHVVVSVDRDVGTHVYFNGEYMGVDTAYTNYPATISNSESFLIGKDTSGNFYTGSVDDVRLYNRTLNADEATLLARTGLGPIAHWKFDENTGTTTAIDSSGNANGATMNSIASTDWYAGIYGSSLYFDGSTNYLNGTLSPSIASKSFSVGFWVKRGASGAQQIIYSSGSNSSNLGLHIGFRSTNVFTCGFWGNDLDTSATYTDTTSWHHWACTYDASNNDRRIYRDGVLVANDTASADFSGSMSYNIGRHVGDGTAYANGPVDDMRIYNYARTPSQVVQDMSAGRPIGSNGNIATQYVSYQFDEGGGQSTGNSANTSHTLTLGSGSGSDTSDPTWKNSSICAKGMCFDFDGSNDYLSTPDDDRLDINDIESFSISGWFSRDTYTTDDTIIAKRNGNTATDAGWSVAVNSNDQLVFEISDGTDEYSFYSTFTFTDANWNHFVIVFDPSNEYENRMFVNGKETMITKSGTLSAIGSAANAFSLIVGADASTNNPFDGKLDQLKLYTGTLTTLEARLDANFGTAVNFGTGSVESAALVDGSMPIPVADFGLNENMGDTDIYDHSGSQNNGTISGTIPWVPGKYGSALSFDGSASTWVTTTATGFPNTNAAQSIALWYKVSSNPAGPQVIYENLGSSVGVFVGFRSSSLGVWKYDGTLLVSTTSPTANQWHHVVYTYDGTTHRLIVDGVEKNTSTTAPNSAAVTAGVIGGNSDTAGQNFAGLVDEVRVYAATLTDAQIAYEYNRGKPIGWWKLDDCQGLSATDATEKGNTGTLTIGATGSNTSAGSCTSGTGTHAWSNGATGKRNASLDFDGTDDYISMGDVNDFDFSSTGDVTITGWFNREAFTTDDTIVAKSNGQSVSNTGYLCWIDDATDNLICNINDGTDQFVITGTTTFTATGWNHFALVWDENSSANSTLYINGKSDKASTTGTIGNIDSISNAQNFTIGAESDAGNPFDGKIDELKIYRYTLSEKQIWSDMNGSATRFGPTTGQP